MFIHFSLSQSHFEFVCEHKKLKCTVSGLSSWICLWFSLWVLTNCKIAGNCLYLFISKGNIWGHPCSSIQPLDLWFKPVSIALLLDPVQVHVRSHYDKQQQTDHTYLFYWMDILLPQIGWVSNWFLWILKYPLWFEEHFRDLSLLQFTF